MDLFSKGRLDLGPPTTTGKFEKALLWLDRQPLTTNCFFRKEGIDNIPTCFGRLYLSYQCKNASFSLEVFTPPPMIKKANAGLNFKPVCESGLGAAD
jgi:hypothetical protein